MLNETVLVLIEDDTYLSYFQSSKLARINIRTDEAISLGILENWFCLELEIEASPVDFFLQN